MKLETIGLRVEDIHWGYIGDNGSQNRNYYRV